MQHISLLQHPPSLLRELLTATTPRDKGVRKNIFKYNNALCMASVHANWVSRGEGQSGVNQTVTLQGRIVISLVLCRPLRADGRLSCLCTFTTPTLMYILSFMSLHELARDNAPTDRYNIVIRADKRPANEHVRRYNGRSCSEVAPLIPDNEDGMIGKRDILVRKRGQATRTGKRSWTKRASATGRPTL